MSDHHRRYDTRDKFALYLAGLAITTLLALQANFASSQVDLTKELAATSVENQIELMRVTTQMGSVIDNQRALQNTVGTIRGQVSRLCESQKKLLPNSNGECY